MKTEKYHVTGMTCAACQSNVTKNVSKLSGIEKVDVSLLANQMTVTYDETALTSENIISAVTGIGYGAELFGSEKKSEGAKSGFRSEWEMRQKDADDGKNALKRRLIASIILLIPLMYLSMGHMMGLPMPSVFMGTENAPILAFTQLLVALPIIYINRVFFKNGYKALWKRSPNMDSLVAIGSTAALVYGLFAIYMMMYGLGHGNLDTVKQYSHELYFESSAMILALVTIGKFLEARSKSKTSDALGKLVDLAPKTAVIIKDGVEVTVPSETVKVGDIVVIRPGDSIPVDGTVISGRGYVDEAAITGESIPVEKSVGSTVISATINKNGSFKLEATKVGDDTTLSQIIRLVDDAGNSKAPIARLADKVSGIFVPTVISIAIITAIVWMIAGYGFEHALSCAISVLVISCPCALGLATPVAIMVGTGKGAELGILFKSAESLETLHSIDTVVLDKTGTITSGHPSVTDIVILDADICEKELLIEAAAAEKGSEHPLALAVVEKAEKEKLTLPEASDFSAHAGRGVTATVNGKAYTAGNSAFMDEQGIMLDDSTKSKLKALASEGKTPLIFARDKKAVGIIAVADTVRDESASAIKHFSELGISVIMLTGDNAITANAIKDRLGIETAISDVLPAEKEAHIRELQEKGHKVAMIGDGINDAPALMRADVGIAIGAGTDIAIDSADVVLMKNSLSDAVTAIKLSRSVMRNIRMNLFWAFFYNILGIPVAAGVLYPAFAIRLSPMIGAAAMSLSSVTVVSNALRLRFFKDKDNIRENTETTNEICEEIPQEKGNDTMKKELIIEGMMCKHCQAHVLKALSAVEGVSEVDVNLEAKKATVTLANEVADDALKAVVVDAGYDVVSCTQL